MPFRRLCPSFFPVLANMKESETGLADTTFLFAARWDKKKNRFGK
jgi:hypothetical protein